MAENGERAQCTVMQLCFLPVENQRLPSGPEQLPAPKKIKLGGPSSGTGIQSMRLRHILLSHDETGTKGKKATRTRQEAEVLLRKAIVELRKEIMAIKNPKDATEIVRKTTPKFVSLCREHSECETAKKAGNICGELGWMTPEQRTSYGAGFREVVDVLLPGQLSDIAASNMGVHLVQRMA